MLLSFSHSYFQFTKLIKNKHLSELMVIEIPKFSIVFKMFYFTWRIRLTGHDFNSVLEISVSAWLRESGVHTSRSSRRRTSASPTSSTSSSPSTTAPASPSRSSEPRSSPSSRKIRLKMWPLYIRQITFRLTMAIYLPMSPKGKTVQQQTEKFCLSQYKITKCQ